MPNVNLEEFIRDIPDFPKKGITFKDITPLLRSPEAMREATDQLYALLPDVKIHKVAGIESRGFIFGVLLAERLGAGFVPVRKPGKLPYQKISATYELEYGSDTLEIHQDAIEQGENVLVHDDLLATGGTAAASGKLIEKLGGNIVQFSFLLALPFLQGREKLTRYQVSTLINC